MPHQKLELERVTKFSQLFLKSWARLSTNSPPTDKSAPTSEREIERSLRARTEHCGWPQVIAHSIKGSKCYCLITKCFLKQRKNANEQLLRVSSGL